MKVLDIFRTVVRILLGAMFILSAVLKLITIDTFETYVYSFHILSFTLAEVAARCLIALEFVTGCFLLLKAQYRWAWWVATLMTAGFTLFLVYVVLFRNDANCHCFGDLIPIEPLHSIYKNIGILAALVFAYRQPVQRISYPFRQDGVTGEWVYFTEKDYSKKFKFWLLGITGGVAFVVLFILFPPNAVYSWVYSDNDLVATNIYDQAYADSSFYLKLSEVEYRADQDTVVFRSDTARLDLDSGSYVLAVVSSGCKYCRQSCDLVNNIFERNNLDSNKLKVLVWGSDESIAHFMKETKTWKYEFHQISPYLAIDLVYGNFPTFAFIRDGKVVEAFDYRGVNERKIVEFVK